MALSFFPVLNRLSVAAGMTEKAASAEIDPRDQLELRWKLSLAGRGRKVDLAGFEQLPRHLEHIAHALEKPVETEYATPSQFRMSEDCLPLRDKSQLVASEQSDLRTLSDQSFEKTKSMTATTL
jgi:hypothetical protein